MIEGEPYSTLFLRAVTTLWAVTILVLPATLCMGQDWLSGYLPRQETTAADSASWNVYLSPTRSLLNLNGTWRARRLASEEGRNVEVPGAFHSAGQIEFSRTFSLDSTLVGKRLRLLAFGILPRFRIFLNGSFVDTRSGGQSPFFVDLPSAKVRIGGRNELRIVVDGQLGPRDSLPLKHHPGLSANFVGIVRDIFILVTQAISIDDVSVDQELSADRAVVQLGVSVALQNSTPGTSIAAGEPKVDLVINILDSAGRALLPRSSRTSVKIDASRKEFKVDMPFKKFQMWSPQTPALYRLRLDLMQARRMVDRVFVPFGVRQVAVNGNGLVVNGTELRLKGIDYYENMVADSSRPTVEDDIRTIKRLGANVVRVVGGPPSPKLLDLCDRLGVFVFAEVPLSLVPDARLRDSNFSRLPLDETLDLFELANRHPSLAAVGIGRDLAIGSPGTQGFLRQLSESRVGHSYPLVYLIADHILPQALPEWTDFMVSQVLDPGSFAEQRKLASDLQIPFFYSVVTPLRPVAGAGTNVGAPSEDLQEGGSGESFSVDAQELQAYELWTILSSTQHSKPEGFLISTLTDWRVDQPNLVFGWNHDSHWIRTGLLNLDGSKRLSYDIVADYFSGKPSRRGVRPKPSSVSPVMYPVIGIGLILLFLFNFNRNKKLRGNLRRIFFYPHGFFSEVRENRKVPAWHTFLLSVMTSVGLGMITSGFAFYFRNSGVANDFLDLLIQSETTKQLVIYLCWHPGVSIAVFTFTWYGCFYLLILILKITSVVMGRYLSFSQLWTLVFWSSANFLWLLPAIPIYYRLLEETNWFAVATLLVTVFMVWFLMRLLKGMKLVFHLSLFNAGVLAIILVTLTVGALAYHFQEESALFDYLPIYWHVFASRW